MIISSKYSKNSYFLSFKQYYYYYRKSNFNFKLYFFLNVFRFINNKGFFLSVYLFINEQNVDNQGQELIMEEPKISLEQEVNVKHGINDFNLKLEK